MKIKRFNEEVGFDDEEMRDRLEIPNMRGELEPSSPNMISYSIPTDKINTQTEIKKIIFREPILDNFHKDTKFIEGSRLVSFFATSKVPVNGCDFYAQLSFAFHEGQYYIGTILRESEDISEENWVVRTFYFNRIEETYKIADAFISACVELGIVDNNDLKPYSFINN